MMRQREFPADARIQDPQLDATLQAALLTARAARAHSIARQGGRRAALARTAPRTAVGRRQALGDQGDELARDVDFRSARDLDLAAGPDDGERIVIAVEGDPLADLVGGNHVELLALEFAARILFHVVGLRRKPDHEGALGS